MCGIFGYVGWRNAFTIGCRGIKDLEYRGYDSVGVALQQADGTIAVEKAAGRLEHLLAKLSGPVLDGRVSVWHTRWATHGEPSERNAHPHGDCVGHIWVVHNGIIENHAELKAILLSRGHRFRSETDTEVLPHLIEERFAGNLLEAVRDMLPLISGTYGIVVMARGEPGRLVAARMASPLIIGLGENERFIASDVNAILPHTREVAHLADGDIVLIAPSRQEIVDATARLVRREPEMMEETARAAALRHPHHMLQEILEQPEALADSLRGRIVLPESCARLGGLRAVEERLRVVESITIVACGTAYYAGLVGRLLLEELAGIHADVELASEFANRKLPVRDRAALLAISQSGETMDTLRAVQEAKANGILALGIVNRVGSQIARLTDAGVYNHAGPEVAVASTKAFVSQLAILVLFAVLLGRQRGMSAAEARKILEDLAHIPDLARQTLEVNGTVAELARSYRSATNFLYLGRGYQYPIALEGALKLKEISYVHAEGYAGGEMKHGPLALIDEDFPTLAIVLRDSWRKKMLSNVQEIKARRGPIIALAAADDDEVLSVADAVIPLPPVAEYLAPIVSVIPLQLFAYHMGVIRGCDVDRPRNLAKSVTTE